MLDKLPAQLRHLLIVVGAAFFGPFAKAILASQGLTGIHWHALLISSANAAVTAALTAHVLLNLTPLTRQYGAFSNAPTPEGNPAAVPAQYQVLQQSQSQPVAAAV